MAKKAPASQALLLFLLLFVLPACGATLEPPPSPPLGLSGERALTWVHKQVFREDGSIRPRIPGTAGIREVAGMIRDALKGYGWEVRWETFTGADYYRLDLQPVRFYLDRCTPDLRNRVRGLTFINVVASYGMGETVVLGAHYDTKRTASQDPDPARRKDPVPGANDGASGVAVLLELARVLPAVLKERRVKLVFFDGEDGFEDCHPLAGSLYHVQHLLPEERRDIKVFILLDMVGDRNASFYREFHSEEGARQWVDRIWALARDLQARRFVNEKGGAVVDDHVSFLHQGIPAVNIIDFRPGRGFPPAWHTTADLPGALAADTLEEVGQVLLHLLTSPLP